MDNIPSFFLESTEGLRVSQCFGDLTLDGVLPDDFLAPAPMSAEPIKRDRDVMAPPSMAPLKRATPQGAPVLLPVYRQNFLEHESEDLGIVETLRAREAKLRTSIMELYNGLKTNGRATHSTAQLRTELQSIVAFVKQRSSELLLKPPTLAVVEQFIIMSQELETYLRVCEAELAGSKDLNALAALIVVHDNLFRSVKQEEEVGPLRLKVITAPNTPLRVPGPKSFSVKVRGEDGTEMDLGTTHSNAQTMESGLVEFKSLQFAKGARKKLCYCVVECVMQGVSGPAVTLRSTRSRLFSVQTNEKQWADLLGEIYNRKLFSGLPAGTLVPRFVVCNELQKIYLSGTRQDITNPSRPLSPFDFSYILDNHAGAGVLMFSQEQTRAVWEWFGQMLSRVRHDRQVHEMWLQGYIMGFVTKESAEQLLAHEAPGSFILRFSSQAPGSFAIAYVDADGQTVKHYLLRKTDVNVSNSLAKFLVEKPYFQTLLQTVPSFSEQQWQRADKAVAFSKWWTASKPDASVPGYDDQLSAKLQTMTLDSRDEADSY